MKKVPHVDDGSSIGFIWAALAGVVLLVVASLGVVHLFHPPEPASTGDVEAHGFQPEELGASAPTAADVADPRWESDYRWVDREAGVAQIPVEDAISWMLEESSR